MKSIFGIVVALSVVGAAGCGSTGTDASGNPTPTPGSSTFCGGFAVGPGLICDSSTTPHTLRVDFGSGANQVPAGNDARFPSPTKGKFISLFTPTVSQANPPTFTSPGGLMTGRGGGIVYNAATQNVGIRAANEICASITNFPGKTEAVPTAHACTNDELLQNAHAGNIPKGATGAAYLAASYASFSTTADTTNNNFKSSCGNWSYDSGDLYTATVWRVDEQNDKALFGADKSIQIKWTTAAAANCGAFRDIACCE